MLRTAFLSLLLLGIAVRTVGAPQAGVLGWTWLTLMGPHQLVWGELATAPVNLILAVVTFISWLFSREPKRVPINLATGLWFAFMAYMTLTTVFALSPDLAWSRWDRTIKIMALGILVASIMTNRVRVHALIWVIVLSLGYFGVKGGLFTIITGGDSRVIGPEGLGIGDNNYLALALCMILPLINYLRVQSEWWLTRIGAIAAMAITVVAVLGTYSRGGLIGLAVTGAYFWWKSKQKIVIAIIAVVLVVPAIRFMPEGWFQRMSTIQTAETDASFAGRVQAWKFAINVAESRPLTGAGFGGTEDLAVYRRYVDQPTERITYGHAAHSIYFQVLGDHGFIGFALYLALLATTWWYAAVARRRARQNPNLLWVRDLAGMVQVSLVAFAAAGAGLSMAYYDLFYLLIGTVIVLRQMAMVGETEFQGRLGAYPASGLRAGRASAEQSVLS
jgi:probable O-glycosylation ligase (exosortase A-associated)